MMWDTRRDMEESERPQRSDAPGIAEWVRGTLGFPADPMQARVLDTGSKR